MITPSFSLTATERVLPRLALDFTTAVLDPRITFTRTGDTATVTDSTGAIVQALADTPRFDYDPTTLACKGLLIEGSRTNSLLNSLLDGTSLATQSVTVTAAVRTLSFYGTGTVTLSGTHSAVVDGVGAYPARTTLVFTPTAGTLTLTVSGTVQFAQLESGNFATSFIPTAGSTVTRTADVASMTGSNFSDWFNSSEGAFLVEASSFFPVSTINYSTLTASDGTNSNRVVIRSQDSSSRSAFQNASGGSNVAFANGAEITGGAVSKMTSAYKLNSFAFGQNGTLVATDNSGAVPVGVNRLSIGSNNLGTGEHLNGHVQQVLYYPQRLINAEVQAFSK